MYRKIVSLFTAGAAIISLAFPALAEDIPASTGLPSSGITAELPEEPSTEENQEPSTDAPPEPLPSEPPQEEQIPPETETGQDPQPEMPPEEDAATPDTEQETEQPEIGQDPPDVEDGPEYGFTGSFIMGDDVSESEEGYTLLELKNSDYLIQAEGNWDDMWEIWAQEPAPFIVSQRACAWRNCSRSIVYGKTSYLCSTHKCSVSGCFRPILSTSRTKCAVHLGQTLRCQISTGNGVTCGKTPYSGSSVCYEHMCPGCLGPGSDDPSKLCSYCMMCWVLGCPNPSTCTNECDEHCPHSCKVHHENHCATCHGAGNCCACNTCAHLCKTHHEDHCLTCHGAGNCCACNTCAHLCKEHHLDHCVTCHSDPCVCFPTDPVIQVGAWDRSNNSITVSFSSDRAGQIEIYTQNGTKVDTIQASSGSYSFYHNAAYHNGSYYVRVKNDAGYNPGSFSFTVSGLDREAPDAHSVEVSPSGWAQEKTVTATADDQTNVLLSLQYADGSPVPGTSEQESPASWTITEKISSSKGFKLVSKDKWGYTSNFSFTVDKIDTAKPTRPTVTKTPSTAWNNGAVSIELSDSTAASGIDHYEYRINDGSWQSGSSITVSTQGVHKVEARAVSEVGLVSDVSSATVQIDTTAPSGSYTLSHQPGTWTTSDVTIQFTPADTGGSGIKSVTLPNGSAASDLNNISYKASQNGNYQFVVTDNAGNVGYVVVPVDYIAMLDVTVTLNSPFVISPDDDKVYGGELQFENHSNVPVKLAVTKLAPVGEAPAVVAYDSRNWKTLSASQTKQGIAIGYTGNGRDVWITGSGEHALGTINKGDQAAFSMKARFGYAWEKPQPLNYAMTVKVSIDQ